MYPFNRPLSVKWYWMNKASLYSWAIWIRRPSIDREETSLTPNYTKKLHFSNIRPNSLHNNVGTPLALTPFYLWNILHQFLFSCPKKGWETIVFPSFLYPYFQAVSYFHIFKFPISVFPSFLFPYFQVSYFHISKFLISVFPSFLFPCMLRISGQKTNIK